VIAGNMAAQPDNVLSAGLIRGNVRRERPLNLFRGTAPSLSAGRDSAANIRSGYVGPAE
jgi:hypothetical protein